MNGISAAIGSFAVNDIGAARVFYGTTLGLQVTDALPGGTGPIWVRAGDGPGVFVYPKPEHEPAGFTVLNLEVDDIEIAIDELTQRGISMQRVDGLPQDERGIFHGEGHSIAWFADPAGNSLSVVTFRPAA
jgi:predicted enzyme related to lactoylglutathione lyase